MPLHYMAVEAAVHQHGALEVHEVAGRELPDIGAVESFLYRRHGVAIVGLNVYHGKAYAVVRYRLVDMQLVGKRAPNREVHIAASAFNRRHHGCFFYYS